MFKINVQCESVSLCMYVCRVWVCVCMPVTLCVCVCVCMCECACVYLCMSCLVLRHVYLARWWRKAGGLWEAVLAGGPYVLYSDDRGP